MRADGAPRVDDGCPDVVRLTVRLPHHVPVVPRFRHGVERVDVLLREGLGGGRLRPLPGERVLVAVVFSPKVAIENPPPVSGGAGKQA